MITAGSADGRDRTGEGRGGGRREKEESVQASGEKAWQSGREEEIREKRKEKEERKGKQGGSKGKVKRRSRKLRIREDV